jgi:dCTP diphosphatase
MSDSLETVAALRDAVRLFVDERRWGKFHAPKNLSMALAIEAAELMEHFQWLTVEESRAVREDAMRRAAVGDELADVVCYALALANELELDVSQAVRAKMLKNAAKYPVDEFRGRFGADDPRPVE